MGAHQPNTSPGASYGAAAENGPILIRLATVLIRLFIFLSGLYIFSIFTRPRQTKNKLAKPKRSETQYRTTTVQTQVKELGILSTLHTYIIYSNSVKTGAHHTGI